MFQNEQNYFFGEMNNQTGNNVIIYNRGVFITNVFFIVFYLNYICVNNNFNFLFKLFNQMVNITLL